MLRTIIMFMLIISGTAMFAEERPMETIEKEFKVEPLKRYCLSFRVVEDSVDSASWVLRIFNREGLLPYEGVFKYDWQKIKPDKREYRHVFLSPRGGDKLLFSVRYTGKALEIVDVRLEEVADSNILINGDFSAGSDNYSGWNTHERAKLVEDRNGKLILKCQPTGYAITDFIPVEAGAVYRYTPGSRTGLVLTYNNDLLRIGVLPPYRHTDPFIKIPAGVNFIRIEYCDGRTWQKGRVPVIDQVGIELVEKGEEFEAKEYSDYPGEIILKANSALAEVRGAREIQHWVKKISGKKMKVLAEPSNKENTKIYVGGKWAEKIFPEDMEYLKDSDGFAVRRKDGDIYIFSAKPAGTLFGAIRFLEKNSDIIFARPREEFGTVYSKNEDLRFEHADFIERPAFAVRMSQSVRANPYHTGIWHGRVGLNSPPYFYNQFRRKEEGGVQVFCSNFMGVINQSPQYSPEIVKKKFPELYAMENGKRVFTHKFICPTHPETVKALTAGFSAVVKEARDNGIALERVGVRVQDGWTVCSCDRCMKPIPLPDGGVLKAKSDSSIKDPLFFSTRKAVLMNEVAKEFAKIYPNINLSTEAYVYASEPPLVPYDPSIIPLFCPYPTCSLRFPLLDKNNSPLWARKFQGFLNWSRTNSGRLSMFAYYYTAGFSAVADSAAADWREMAEAGGVDCVIMDGFPADNNSSLDFTNKTYGSWEYAAIEKWIMTRLMWDPTLDPQKLREYYIKRAYQEAAPEMLSFYNIIRRVWKDPSIKISVNCHTPMSVLFEKLIVETGHEKELRSLLVRALEKAVNINSKTLIKRMLTGFDKMADTVNRINVPYVVESTAEWNKYDSTFWIQALTLGEFKRVSTWDNFNKAPAENQTIVSVMRDNDILYFRFEALGAQKQDTVELVIEASRNAAKYYFSLSRDGKHRAMRNFSSYQNPQWRGEVKNEKKSYIAMFSIPLAIISGVDVGKKELKVFTKFSRVVSAGEGKEPEESSLTGFAVNRCHYMNYWTGLTINREKN